jgi:hypothetical protein
MGRKSSIDELDPRIRRELKRLILEDQLTIDAIVDHLSELGVDDISRSAVGRYKKREEKLARRLRQSREVTDALATNMSEAETQGKQGRLLVEISRTLVYDMIAGLEEGENLDPKDIAMLGKGLAEMARAARFDQDFEQRVADVVKAEREASARKLTDAVQEGRLDAHAAEEARRIMGFV